MSKNKLVIGILTYNRTKLLEKTLLTFYKYNAKEDIKMILLDNNSSKEESEINKSLAKKYDIEYFYNKYDVSDDLNKNIEIGHMSLIKHMLDCDSEMCCILEDDWECIGRIPINEIMLFLNEHKNIGQVRLRDFKYDDTMYGGSSVNFVTKEKIIFNNEIVYGDVSFKVADMHWVNCCTFMRKDVLERMDNVYSAEMERMKAFYKMYPANAQMIPGIFYHIGPWRVREDLRKQGLFGGSNENIS